jgi:signal transduction histidine kinase
MKHLRQRVLFQILIPTLIAYVGISSYAFIVYRNSYKESMIEKKNTEMLNVSRVLGDWVSGRIRELMIISRSEFLGDSGLYQEYLSRKADDQSSQFKTLWFIRENGKYWNTENGIGEIFNKEEFNLLFSKELLFLYLVPDYFDNYSNNPIILFAVPIEIENEVVGVLGGSIEFSEFDRLLKLYTYKLFDEIGIIDVDQPLKNGIGGKVIVHSNSEYNGVPEEDVYDQVYSFNTHYKQDNYFVTTLINYWKFVGKINSEALFFQLEMVTRFFILITFLIILVIGFLAIGISQLISNPILSLTDMVNDMLQGKFTNEITVRTKDELQLLANAFNLLNRRNIQLRTDDRFSFLGRISSRMAHEIRHPLHIIQIAMQTINEDNFKKNSSIIFQEINKAEMFIREILEIAKPNELSLEHYSMARLVDNVYQKFTMICEDKQINIDLYIDSRYDSFYFDVLKIEQVFTNILNNSIDVTPKGGVITIRIKNDQDRNIRIIISDTGPGFSQDVIDRVFDPYFTTKKDGTGLGLSICYQILTAHGAQIELSNSPTGGAVTTLIFSSFTD